MPYLIVRYNGSNIANVCNKMKLPSILVYLFITYINAIGNGNDIDSNNGNTTMYKVPGKELLNSMDEVGGIFNVVQKWTTKFEKFRKRLKKAYHRFISDAFYQQDDGSDATSLSNTNKEESDMVAYELITHHGYRVQTHTVETEDGYLLRVFRLISREEDSTVAKKTVLLLHGLMGSSDDWLLLGPEAALPYKLIKIGCDVWLPNFRGNKYSNIHMFLSNNSTRYWNFSFHEMGTKDLKSIINYVNDTKNGMTDIHLVAHSMGATAALVLLTTEPKYNHVLKSATLLAPLAFMHEVKGPLKYLADLYVKKKYKSLSFFGLKSFIDQDFPPEIEKMFCVGDKLTCLNPLLLLANGGKPIQNQVLLKKVMGHLPDDTSSRTIYHYIQLIASGKFQNVDYGVRKNSKAYCRISPPVYELDNVTLPIHVFSSNDDWLSTISNVFNLMMSVRNVVTNNVIKKKGFTHLDFVWGEDAPDFVFAQIVKVLKGDKSKRRVHFIQF